jgi:hypothetical protein
MHLDRRTRVQLVVAFIAMSAAAALAFVKEDEAAVTLIIVSALFILSLFVQGLRRHLDWKRNPDLDRNGDSGRRRVLAHHATIYTSKRPRRLLTRR